MNPSHAALACCAALAGCVGVPVDELLASTGIVAELPLESGARVEAARFSAGRAGESQPGWGRFIVSPFATKSEYALVESGPGVVLGGRADGSASGFYRRIHIDPKRHPVMEWRWRVLQTPADLDPRVNARDDSPVGTITPSIPTGKIQTIVVESGGGTGEWRELRRNVLEDYRLAFGEEPWDIVGVGVMTDARNTHEKASAQFGDISFRPER